MSEKVIPNKSGPKVKKGDTVHVTNKEGEIIVGEVVSFVEGFKNWIKEVNVKGKDGYTLIEVKYLGVELVQIISLIVKSTFWQKVSAWFRNIGKNKKRNNNQSR